MEEEIAAVASLRVHHWLPRVRETLGPGSRAVVWVQGCSLACPGCMVPETWAPQGGSLLNPVSLAREILTDPDIDGVTLTGGEPTEQPAAVSRLLREIKRAGKNTWLYTGYTLEELLARDDPELDRLLSCVDVLVDGRYQASEAGTLRLRGSANQRLLHLTGAIPPLSAAGERSSRVDITLDDRGGIVVVGVPPPGFLRRLKASLEAQGLGVEAKHWR